MRTFCAALAVCVFSAPAFAGETPIVRFDAAGVNIDGKRVDSAALELRSAGEGALLASTRCVESISGLLSVELAPGRMLKLEPGVRVERKADGFRLSNLAGRKIRLAGPEGEISNAATVDFSVTADGWTVAGVAVTAASLEAALPKSAPVVEKQDTGADANTLQRLRTASKRTGGTMSAVWNVLGYYLLTFSEATDSQSVKRSLEVFSAF